jgi:anhydro-N-acetylmuramic acid kinase
VDGIDVAIVDITDRDLRLIAHDTVPYAPDVRAAILGVSNTDTHTSAIARLNFLLGELFAEALIATAAKRGVPMDSIELIGSHGQTIFHEGEPVEFCGHRVASTMQIGEGSVIALRTRIATFSDFRVADIAAGGKGAPLVPFLDYRLFRSDTIGRVALNIGGIANITVIPKGATPSDVIAFDTGPGNMVMDALAPPYDQDGEKARAGTVNRVLLERLLQDPYYQQPPPKTAGREQYGAEFLKCGIDIATAAELTVQTITLAIARYSAIDEVIVSGGGAHNSFLMERFRAVLPQTVVTSAERGMDIDAKEAVLFALLAYESCHGRPCNIPSATGARIALPLGKLF